MKAAIIKKIILLFLGLLIVYSCTRDHDLFYQNDDGQNDEATVISEARQWYNQRQKGAISLQALKDAPEMLIKPHWEYSFVSQNEEYITVEAMILPEKYFGFVLPECLEEYKKTKNTDYLLSKTQLVIRKNRQTNQTDGFLMTISPTLEYLKSSKFRPFRKNYYLKRDKNFNGYIFYHDLNGQFVNAWRYIKGEAYATTTKEKVAQTQTMQLQSMCEYYTEMEYFISECDAWANYENGGYEFVANCSTHYEYDYYFTDCYDGGGGYGDGGYDGENYWGNEDNGGGGDNGNKDNPPNNTDDRTEQEKICDTYHGTIDVASFKCIE
jgi:hypothetical protein